MNDIVDNITDISTQLRIETFIKNELHFSATPYNAFSLSTTLSYGNLIYTKSRGKSLPALSPSKDQDMQKLNINALWNPKFAQSDADTNVANAEYAKIVTDKYMPVSGHMPVKTRILGLLSGGGTPNQRDDTFRQTGGGNEASAKFLYGEPDCGTNRYLASTAQLCVKGPPPTYTGTNGTEAVRSTKLGYVSKFIRAMTYTMTSNAAFGSKLLSADLNNDRVVLLGMLDYLIRINDKLNNTTLVAARPTIKKAIDGWSVMEPRLKYLRSNKKQLFTQLTTSFITGFLLGAQEKLTLDSQGKLIKLPDNTPRPQVQKKMLDTVYDFYKNDVVKNLDLYKQFFNLLHKQPSGNFEPVALDAAKDLDKDVCKEYRLNNLKIRGYKLFGGAKSDQYGGIDTIFDELVFFTLRGIDVPTGIGNIWVDTTQFISAVEFSKKGKNALRLILRDVYNTPSTQSKVLIPTFNITIDVQASINRALRYPVTIVDTKGFYAQLLKQFEAQTPSTTMGWREREDKFSEYMMMLASKWQREDRQFVRYKDDGTVDESLPADNCAFIDFDADKCVEYIQGCALSKDSFPVACENLAKEKFDTNIAPTLMKEKIFKINPLVALAFLNKFNFQRYLGEEDMPIKGLRVWRVESVGQWLQNMEVMKDKCDKSTDDGKRLAKFFCDLNDNKYNMFLNWLDILVDWVNANPQVLNEELNKAPDEISPDVPDIDKRFRIYGYTNPYKPSVRTQLVGLCDDLERMKGSITNEMAGLSAPTMLANLATTPTNISIPFNRAAFSYSVPYYNAGQLMTGGIGEIEKEIAKLSNAHGYVYLLAVYNQLKDLMKNMKGKRTLALSNTTAQKIDEKFLKLKAAEEDYRRLLRRESQRAELYQNSHGYIAAMEDSGKLPGIPDDPKYVLPAVARKHANLVPMAMSVNKRSHEIINVIQTLAMAISDYADKHAPSRGKYYPSTNTIFGNDIRRWNIDGAQHMP